MFGTPIILLSCAIVLNVHFRNFVNCNNISKILTEYFMLGLNLFLCTRIFLLTLGLEVLCLNLKILNTANTYELQSLLWFI